MRIKANKAERTVMLRPSSVAASISRDGSETLRQQDIRRAPFRILRDGSGLPLKERP